MEEKTVIMTNKAPQAIGPYSQAIVTGDFLFVSGQIGVDPRTNVLQDGIIDQTTQVIHNTQAILREAGTDLAHVVKTTVFLVSMQDFSPMNEVYSTFFKEKQPARSTVIVAQLPKGALCEIECIAKMI